MKIKIKVVSNIFTTILIFILIIQVGPRVYNSFKMYGESFPILEQYKNQKKLVIFWATWCPPCKLELDRINNMIKSGDIQAQQVIAVNMGESKSLVEQHLKEEGYLFLNEYDESGELSTKMNVNVTPSIFFVNQENKISWATSGVSPTLYFRIKFFFK